MNKYKRRNEDSPVWRRIDESRPADVAAVLERGWPLTHGTAYELPGALQLCSNSCICLISLS